MIIILYARPESALPQWSAEAEYLGAATLAWELLYGQTTRQQSAIGTGRDATGCPGIHEMQSDAFAIQGWNSYTSLMMVQLLGVELAHQ